MTGSLDAATHEKDMATSSSGDKLDPRVSILFAMVCTEDIGKDYKERCAGVSEDVVVSLNEVI